MGAYFNGHRLPDGRGSVSTCKQVVTILSRARQQAGFGFISTPTNLRNV
jgi:hypothetical protein